MVGWLIDSFDVTLSVERRNCGSTLWWRSFPRFLLLMLLYIVICFVHCLVLQYSGYCLYTCSLGSRNCSFLLGCACIYLLIVMCFEIKRWWWRWFWLLPSHQTGTVRAYVLMELRTFVRRKQIGDPRTYRCMVYSNAAMGVGSCRCLYHLQWIERRVLYRLPFAILPRCVCGCNVSCHCSRSATVAELASKLQCK